MISNSYLQIRRTAQLIKSSLSILLIIAAVLFLQLPIALAHEGEDQNNEKAEAPIAASGQMNVKLAKTSNLDVLIKYPTPKSGAETPIHIFVTDLTTNAPVGGVN